VDGRIENAVTFACGPNWRTDFRQHPDLLDAARRIIEHVRYTGVVNFDCRLDADTNTFTFFECNPRFFRRVTAARLCGLNFADTGFCSGTAISDGICYFPPRDVCTREGVKGLARGRWPLSVLATDIIESVSDPIPAFVQSAAWAPAILRAMSPLLQRVAPSKLRKVS
jgi:predicted ATP-grasp superfamily ATP-dependent carboligase